MSIECDLRATLCGSSHAQTQDVVTRRDRSTIVDVLMYDKYKSYGDYDRLFRGIMLGVRTIAFWIPKILRRSYF